VSETVGQGVDRGQHPDSVGGKRKPRRVIRLGTETSVVLGSTLDDADEDALLPNSVSTKGGANDERLKRDVPPHW
jgi:hypothetical protein